MATITIADQDEVESDVREIYSSWLLHGSDSFHKDSGGSGGRGLQLLRNSHVEFLFAGLEHLSSGYGSLDASRPWISYWILHALAILEEPLDSLLALRAIDTLAHCQHPDGGFCGGPGQMPHLATTYAAVMALVSVGGEAALAVVNRPALLRFLLRMKQPSGAFSVHDGGEVDVRGCYTALAVAHILNLPTSQLTTNVAGFIKSCQTYEGGIGGEPGGEAHGGYTFCGLAALLLTGVDPWVCLDLPQLLDWLVFRQGRVEGGFQGRSNKLVDSCYSFWQGDVFPLLALCCERQAAAATTAAASRTAAATSTPAAAEAVAEGVNPHAQSVNVNTSKHPVPAEPLPAATLETESSACDVSNNRGMAEHGAATEAKPSQAASEVGGDEKAVDKGDESSSGNDSIPADKGDSKSDSTIADKAVDGSTGNDSMLADDPILNQSPATLFISPHAAAVALSGQVSGQSKKVSKRAVEACRMFPCPERTSVQLLSSRDAGGGGEGIRSSGSDRGVGKSGGRGAEEEGTERLREQEEQRQAGGGCSSSTPCQSVAPESSGMFHTCGFNSAALQAYILLCCQIRNGGLRDKPGKPKDYYHTCYALSGLAAAQHTTALCSELFCRGRICEECKMGRVVLANCVLGSANNILPRLHPLCNVRMDKYAEAIAYYGSLVEEDL